MGVLSGEPIRFSSPSSQDNSSLPSDDRSSMIQAAAYSDLILFGS